MTKEESLENLAIKVCEPKKAERRECSGLLPGGTHITVVQTGRKTYFLNTFREEAKAERVYILGIEELAFWERAFLAVLEMKGCTVEEAAKWADAATECRAAFISWRESRRRLNRKGVESSRLAGADPT